MYTIHETNVSLYGQQQKCITFVFLCVCVCLTVRLGGDPQGGGAFSWPHIVVSDDPKAVALLWFQVGHRQLQRLWLRHIH